MNVQHPPVPNWYFDEFAHAGPEHLDPAYVAAFDRKSAVDPAADLALLRDQGLDQHGTLVDLGAGTGAFALVVAPHCRRVVAVDVSPAMLALLRERVGQQGLDNVEVASGGFLSYEHGGAPADAVYSRHALHHLPDFWKAIALMRVAAMLRPGGIFLLRDLIFVHDAADLGPHIDGWLAGAAARPDQGWTRAELEEHLRQEYSTFTWLLEPMLERAGFAILQADHGASGIYAMYLCVKRQDAP